MINFKDLFEKRSKCLLYNATKDASDNCGWIGGNPPEYFDDKISLINTEGVEYSFYLTIENPIDTENAISIFIPKNFNDRINNNEHANCSIKIFEHKITGESNNSFFRNDKEINKNYIKFDGKTDEEKIDTQYTVDFDETVDESFGFLIKFGGKPVHIQGNQYYYEALHNKGYTFIFQIDEDGYPNDFVKTYPFNYGALYIYGKINDNIVNDIIVGYWQYS
jgi:hypothetical protein